MAIGPLFFSAGPFWLAIPVLLALVVARLFRTRRREIMAGSLLLWRRLAAQQPKLPPRRVIIDASLLLQFATMLAIIAALSGPTWALGAARGREVLLVLDNGPLSRARGADGQPLLSELHRAAESRLRELSRDDRVFLARSSPTPRLLDTQPLTPGAALQELRALTPALSGPDPESLWRFSADTARQLDSAGTHSIRREVLSLRAGPPDLGSQWRCVAPLGLRLDNVAIVAAGSALISGKDSVSSQFLVRLKNFSTHPADGRVLLNGADAHPVHLEAGGDASVVFSVSGAPAQPLRIAWSSADGKKDALPEDDAIVAVPRALHPPRIRFFPASVPVLEKLFREITPPAVIVPPSDTSDVDLEIRAGNVPEAMPATAKALMLLSPDSGFRSFFEIPGGVLKAPQAQKDADDPLTRFFKSTPDSLFSIPRARQIQVTGDMTVLIKDHASNRPLVARWDERGHPVFVFAFVPGQGFAPDRPLEPELAALLVGMADRAAGNGEPYAFERAHALEERLAEPLALAWTPDSDENMQTGAGVLDETTSNLVVGKPSAFSPEDTPAWTAATRTTVLDLTPWLIALALLLAVYEHWRERPRTSLGDSKPLTATRPGIQ